MKRIALFGTATAIALTAMASGVTAQPGGQFGGQPGGMGRGPIFDFAQTDADGDGKVTQEEIMAAGQARLDAAFEKADANADGEITKEEITAFMEARAEAQRAARRDQAAQRMMEFADADEDGVLTKDEVFPQPRGDGSFFSRFDTDEDGAISEEEFAAAQDRFQRRMGDGPRGSFGDQRGGNRGMGWHDHGDRGWGDRGHGPRAQADRGMGGGARGEGGLMRLFLDMPAETSAE
ncbi:EF-hand domain-containing protein [Ferrimonas balearica]|nr:EF-hand domain-containing protein [Ferrimonas balearica]